jgi:hypothetical protein
MPSSVCLRSGLVPTNGVALADGGVDAAISGFDGATRGVEIADGRGDGPAATGDEDGRGAGADEARGAEGAEEARGGAGVEEARGGAGVEEARGAGAAEARGACVDEAAAEAGAAAVAPTCGSLAGAGISSAPHSESMSSVGGAIEGMGGLPLTRSLSDRFSVIALTCAFSWPAAQIKRRSHTSVNGRSQGGPFRQRRTWLPVVSYQEGASCLDPSC